VKELARETAKATEEIGRKIEAIQRSSKGAIDGVAQVKETVGRIHAIQSAIAQSVAEQAQTTAEIGRNVGEAARASEEIAQSIDGVARMAQTTRGGASESQAAAARLSEQSRELWRQLEQFKRRSSPEAGQALAPPAPLVPMLARS
jgi:methyl-accepting chemotaxis protein